MAEQERAAGHSAGNVARYASLEVLRSLRSHPLPQPAADLIWSRQLLPVITRAGQASGPFGTEAPIVDPGAQLSITYAVCPPGTGPGLHDHRRTFETFTVMRGRFRFELGEPGDPGAETIELDELDVVMVPPGIYRAFRNVGTADGVLQVIITGGIHDANDIVFPASVARQLEALDPAALTWLRGIGLEFRDV